MENKIFKPLKVFSTLKTLMAILKNYLYNTRYMLIYIVITLI